MAVPKQLIEQHKEQWLRNRDFLGCIPPKHNDWLVTAAFYTALHAVDALLLAKGHSTHSHSSRNAILSQTRQFLAVYRSYQPLYMLSRTVRYVPSPSKWVPAEAVESRVIRGCLYPIEKSVVGLGGFEIDLPPLSLRAANG